jgi:two-component system sensor histidine kinase AlgZ
MTAPFKYWMRMVTGNISAAIVVTVVFSGLTWRTPWRDALEAFAVALLFSLCIGPALATIMPRLGRRVWSDWRFPLNWIAMVAVMLVIATAGSLLAITLLASTGYLHGRGLFATWFAGALRISIIITLTFGILVTAYEMMRTQLDATTLALRTKERDEAEARRLAVEAQLASIESRVQPHFLFNTLNSIAALVHDDPAGAERMTGQLASLLRSALDSSAVPLVTLDEELRIVQAYLDIERVRFGDRLRYDVRLADGTGFAMVPRMALQTLVENSVKYAVSPRREGGAIRLSAVATDGRVHITVEDDGPGFDAANRPEGHGLALLDARLAMLMGDTAAMLVESNVGRTRVTIEVPM